MDGMSSLESLTSLISPWIDIMPESQLLCVHSEYYKEILSLAILMNLFIWVQYRWSVLSLLHVISVDILQWTIPINSYSANHDNWCTVGGDGGCRVGEVRAGTTSPRPDHKGFKLQWLVNFQKFSTLRVKSLTNVMSVNKNPCFSARILWGNNKLSCSLEI